MIAIVGIMITVGISNFGGLRIPSFSITMAFAVVFVVIRVILILDDRHDYDDVYC